MAVLICGIEEAGVTRIESRYSRRLLRAGCGGVAGSVDAALIQFPRIVHRIRNVIHLQRISRSATTLRVDEELAATGGRLTHHGGLNGECNVVVGSFVNVPVIKPLAASVVEELSFQHHANFGVLKYSRE